MNTSLTGRGGGQAQAPDGGPELVPLLKHPYRPPAAFQRRTFPPLRLLFSPLCRFVAGLPSPPRGCRPLSNAPVATVVASIASAAIAAAASRNLNELAVAGVRAMLGFECRRAVVQ